MKNFQNKAKIIQVSKILRTILFAGAILWGVAIGVFLFDLIFPLFVVPKNAIHATTIFTLGSMGLLASIGLVVNLRLFRFFDRLKNGNLFDAQTVGCLSAAGKWWIVFWLCEGVIFEIGDQIFRSRMTATWDFGGLFAGLALLFVAWLLKEAQELQEEQELTV